jgi:hypothetical protein
MKNRNKFEIVVFKKMEVKYLDFIFQQKMSRILNKNTIYD